MDEVIRLEPCSVNAYKKRGLMHYKLQKYFASVGDFGAALELDENNHIVRLYRANALKKLKQYPLL